MISYKGLAADVDYNSTFKEVAEIEKVPELLLKSICYAESKLDILAFNYGDQSDQNHAFGICQVLYETAADLGLKDSNCTKDFRFISRSYKDCKLFGIKTNITYAARYLKQQMLKYNDSWISSIAAYNSGSLRTCNTGVVKRRYDGKILYRCEIGGLLNQRYVDRVLYFMEQLKL